MIEKPTRTDEQIRALAAANSRLQRAQTLYLDRRRDYRAAMDTCREAIEILTQRGMDADPSGERLIRKAIRMSREAQSALDAQRRKQEVQR